MYEFKYCFSYTIP